VKQGPEKSIQKLFTCRDIITKFIYADQKRFTVGWLVEVESSGSQQRSITTFALL
jgi:hypothetical protein